MRTGTTQSVERNTSPSDHRNKREGWGQGGGVVFGKEAPVLVYQPPKMAVYLK